MKLKMNRLFTYDDMTIGEKELDKIIYQCFIEELEDVGTVFTESAKRIKEFIEQERYKCLIQQ